MNKAQNQTRDQIRALFDSQSLAVLATSKDDQPYASLVLFVVTPDLKEIVFLTPDTTRKYDHLIHNPKVAVLINDTTNRKEDIDRAASVTATGIAAIFEHEKKDQYMGLYLNRHPHLKSFSDLTTTALVCVTVDRYILVTQFQNVVEIQMTKTKSLFAKPMPLQKR
jgi:nitroimidazol reductase NimA-like FMN-containing flavoprotein (pyridoxamine 5'-phosphate oxidase superfamily)